MTDNNRPSYYQDDVSSGNPAWNDLLQSVPEEHHQAITPHLKNWDQGVNHKIEKIKQEYAPWEAYKSRGVNPADVDFALQTLNHLNENPVDVYTKLQEYLTAQGLIEQQQQYTQGQESEPVEIPDDPRIAELYAGFGTLAESYLTDQQRQIESAEDAALARELKQMTEKYGDYDEDYVLALMQNGLDTEDAVKVYFEKVEQITRHRSPAPKVIGSAGFNPGQPTIDPRKLNDRQTRDLVSDMLKSMNAES
jgi:hypothetical protein